ncbi:MAG TPA: UvrD-helicase domain-containing protein [Candidatus Cloacimonas sp.]|nr:UvrD-helicase domain-containing protein [Candidatus Cloacimonas sp.]
MLPDYFARELNDRQLEVVTDTEHPILVLAGAGSGKTRSIIYRAAYLIKEKQVPPWKLLMVTFTNKAAKELQERLEKLLGIPMRTLWVGTFHSLCSRILRFESIHLPFNSNYSIYDEDAQKSLLKKLYKEHGFDAEKLKINRVLSKIGGYKNRLLLPEDLLANYPEEDKELGSILNIYRLYQQQLLLNQALDFDDILLYTARLLQSNEAVREKYRAQFQYIMIDEYQDTNAAQFEIIHQLASGHQRVCVVGDDDQAIYSFRGASLRNILEFEKDYREVRSIRLEQNYRSTGNILALANAVIKHNRRRHVKELWSEHPPGEKPRLRTYHNEIDEANQVVEEVKALHKKGMSYQQIAILYRTNAQSRVFESSLMQARIPYSIVGGQHFYQRKEIKDLLCYLATLCNNSDNESLLRIINEPPRGIGQTSVNRLISYAAKTRISIYSALQNSEAIEELGSGAKKRISEFTLQLNTWKTIASQSPALEVVKTIVEELGLISQYRKSSDPREIARAENLIEFVSSVSEFSEKFQRDNERHPLVEDFLPFVALQTDMDMVKEEADSLRLMTLHNAKGLEFEAVFIVGLEEELLPHRMSMDSREEIEEERRLFYVGITRAKRILQLSNASSRRLYDTFYFAKPSQFIGELDVTLFDLPDGDPGIAPAPQRARKPQKVIKETQKHYRIGQKVYHNEYGLGVILSVDGESEDARLTISFAGKLAKIMGNYVKTEF